MERIRKAKVFEELIEVHKTFINGVLEEMTLKGSKSLFVLYNKILSSLMLFIVN